MGGKVLIQIRKEEKRLNKSHVAEAFEMSRATLNKKIRGGGMSPPTEKNNKYSLKDVEKLFEQLGTPSVILRGQGKVYFEDTIQCDLTIVEGGIFLFSPEAKGKRKLRLIKQFKKNIKESSLLDAQGSNNHIHLLDCGIENPILQLVLAKQITHKWLEKLEEIRPRAKVLIDWLGAVDTVVCIYLMPSDDEKYINKLEKEQGIKRALVKEIEL
jgi:hypothetical protein